MRKIVPKNVRPQMVLTVTRNGETEMSQGYAYDKLNRLTSISDNGTVIVTYVYDNKGNRTQSITSAMTTYYNYNIANLLTVQMTGSRHDETHTYYLNGNLKTKEMFDNVVTVTPYTYDGMNRLVSEGDTTYTFDDFGNRATMTDGDVTVSYTYDLNNRLTGISTVSNGVTTTEQYTYDAGGNQLTKTVSGETVATYAYNCYNQLIQSTVGEAGVSYAYAPDGLRASKTAGNAVTLFVYDNASIIEEICGTDVNKYYRGIGIVKNSDNLYYLYDGLGDVVMLFTSTGPVAASYEYDAYGNTEQNDTLPYNPFGYKGEYFDAETGFVYLRARYYDPSTGRFINEDPIRDGLNWYVYANNNPIRYIDPWGLAIILSGTGVEKQTIYDNLRLLTRDTVSYTVAENGDWLLDYKSVNGEKFNVGTNLIRKIIDNTYTCLIMVDNSEGSGAKPIIREHASRPEMGTGGIIRLNTSEQGGITSVEYVGENGKVEVEMEYIPTEIALGHELIHVLRFMGGNYVPHNKEKNEGYALYEYNHKSGLFGTTRKVKENWRIEELETMGISYYHTDGTYVDAANWSTTENALRKEQGYRRRVKY